MDYARRALPQENLRWGSDQRARRNPLLEPSSRSSRPSPTGAKVFLDIKVIVLCITRENALSDSSPELPVSRPTIPGRYLNPEMLTDPAGRAVDTVAHEIAHFLLGHHENEKRTISARPGASAGAGATKGSRWSEERRAMGTCKYEACGTIAEVDDQGACPSAQRSPRKFGTGSCRA